MAVTRSWEAPVAVQLESIEPPVPAERRLELWWLAAASLFLAMGLLLVFAAKTRDFGDEQARLQNGSLLNLNQVTSADQLLPYLLVFSNEDERRLVADRVWTFLQRNRPAPNVGSLARLRLKQSEVEGEPGWDGLRTQMQKQVEQRKASGDKSEVRIPLLPLARVKPLLAVRTPAEFRREFAIWIAVYFAVFYLVHAAWRWRKFAGDPAILPALHLLSGVGLILAVSLRDPLRDTLEFSKFAWGVAAGCLLLLLPLLRAFHYRRFSKWIYTPLFAAFALFVLLLRFGSGPTGSDSKVNLGPFQPVELIKILLVLFMAGYFANRWEWLREVRERRLIPTRLRWLEIPRIAHALPVMCAVAFSLALFFLLKDLGPALVIGFLFLVMFGVARNRAGLALFGIGVLVFGVWAGYRMGKPQTVVDRISMWQSPWDNDVRGGDQLAHSFWAFSTGGPLGSGPGSGDPGMIPAGHTDLVLPAIGEEWGFAGVLAVGLLFICLMQRSAKIALDAADAYGMFLAMGLCSLIALEMLLISGGVLGAIPLSGVVSPFLSSGNTAMLANFLIFAVILSISNRKRAPSATLPFRRPVRVLSIVLLVCASSLVGKAAWLQVMHDRDFLARDAKVFAADGVKRPQHNPRLNSLARELIRGDIFDRNGVLLATSKWDDLEQHRAAYEQLGVSIDKTCSRLDGRHYPFGAATAHLLGDLRTGENFHATNASLIEHDQNAKLQGFQSYAELGAVVRYRHHPGNPEMERLRSRDRTVRTSIDIRLQLRAAAILEKNLTRMAKQKGALVIMDANSGDVLAMVSAPAPVDPGNTDEMLDRARYAQYPPGSTFKLVTAIAALRLDPELEKKRFHCRPLGDGRVGTLIPGWRRPIRDDIGDSAHGTLDMFRAITVSCNAYFAQLGVYSVGAQRLKETTDLLEIPAGDVAELKQTMPFASYGQGPVLVTPFKMARVAATIAAGGQMPQGRWVLDDSNSRTLPAKPILKTEEAGFIARAMRSVVTGGTGRRAMAGLNISVAGKTGTAQMDEGEPHGWFAGFAPFEGGTSRRIAFAVVVEHGGYGGLVAAPVARELVEAARDLGIIGEK